MMDIHLLERAGARRPRVSDGVGTGAPDALVPLQDLLADDPNGVALKRLRGEWDDVLSRVRVAPGNDSDRADRERREALCRALEAAAAVAERVWEEQNVAHRSVLPPL